MNDAMLSTALVAFHHQLPSCFCSVATVAAVRL